VVLIVGFSDSFKSFVSIVVRLLRCRIKNFLNASRASEFGNQKSRQPRIAIHNAQMCLSCFLLANFSRRMLIQHCAFAEADDDGDEES
jgi:hypothetical protein